MANLDLTADRAVRDAVDAFLEGRLAPEFAGETVFETKNSRYHLLDGVVFAAPDDSLVGSELVGWLMESRRRSVVESAWQPGSRAVLVDRHRGRNIIVTSTTRLLHLEEHASSDGLGPPSPGGRQAPSPNVGPPPPNFWLSPGAPILAATPPPTQVSPTTEGSGPRLPPSAPLSAAAVQRRAAAIHLPPRPLALSPRPAATTPTPLPQPGRPLPVPALPPRRSADSLPQVNPEPPEASTEWEVTSGEFQVDDEATVAGPPVEGSAPYDALRYEGYEASPDELADEAEFGNDTPIPLVRPIDRASATPPPEVTGHPGERPGAFPDGPRR